MSEYISRIDFNLFVLSIVFFFIGFFAAKYIVQYQIRFLLCYPLWMWKKIKQFIKKRPSFWMLLFLIFTFNAVSLLLNVVSGLTIILPFVFAIWIGLNVGIVAYKEGGLKAQLFLLFSPHAFFELPAAWISLTLGMQIGRYILLNKTVSWEILSQYFEIYLKIVLLLLIVAALIESALMHFLMKRLEHTAPFSNKPFNTQQQNGDNQQI